MKRLPLIYIEWDDHHANAAWQDAIDHEPAHCLSVGWLYEEDDRGLTLVSNVTDDSVGNSQYILKSCITKRKLVKRTANDRAEASGAPRRRAKAGNQGGAGGADSGRSASGTSDSVAADTGQGDGS